MDAASLLFAPNQGVKWNSLCLAFAERGPTTFLGRRNSLSRPSTENALFSACLFTSRMIDTGMYRAPAPAAHQRAHLRDLFF